MTFEGIVRRFAGFLAVLGLLVSACTTEETDASATSSATGPVEPTTTESAEAEQGVESDARPDEDEADSASPTEAPEDDPVDILDEASLQTIADRVQVAEGAFLIAVVDGNGDAHQASVGVAQDGAVPTSTDTFRVGSITKVFTALTTLTLVDDGLVDLESPVSDYVTRVAVPEGLTVRDLLQHRSGLFDTVSVEGFLPQILVDQARVWTPEEQMELISDRRPLFAPGAQFSYSSTNYVVLGVLIEEVTGRPYHEAVRNRITDPLALSSTYLAGFEAGPEPFDPYTNPSVTADGESFGYTAIASAAWSAGAMVSSAPDLHTLFVALFKNQIISPELTGQVTTGVSYGLGVELDDWPNGLVGHTGGIFGYLTFVRHSVESEITAFFALTDDGANPLPARRPLVDALAAAGSATAD